MMRTRAWRERRRGRLDDDVIMTRGGLRGCLLIFIFRARGDVGWVSARGGAISRSVANGRGSGDDG